VKSRKVRDVLKITLLFPTRPPSLVTRQLLKEEKMKSHKDLNVWKNSMALAEEIYRLTANFPKEEIYGLTSQIRRSAVSIPSNIAEGSARNSTKEFIQFLYIALGSAAELETQLILSNNLGFLTDLSILEDLGRVRSQLINLIKSLKGKVTSDE